jgi:hypothetical protein
MPEGGRKSGSSLLLVIILALLAVSSGVFTVYSWNQLGRITGDLKEGTEELPAWRELAAEIRKIDGEKKAAESTFIDVPDSQYQNFFESEARKAGFSLTRIDPGKPKEFSEELNQRLMSVDTEETTVRSLVTFLYAVQSKKPNLKITTIDMDPSKKEEGLWKCEIKISAYFRKD